MKIKSIKKIELKSKRYDITVKDTHNFFANNILIHNCQNHPELINEFQGLEVYISQKMDGSSATYYHKDGEFGVCSRNLELREQEGGKYWIHVKKYNLFEALKNKGNYAIVGETAGPSIQANRIGLSELSFYAFNLWNIDEQKYCNYDEFVSFCFDNNIPTVPILYHGIFNFKSVDELLEFSNKQLYPNKTPAEGIVVRTKNEKYSDVLRGRSSFKVISNIFALKYGE